LESEVSMNKENKPSLAGLPIKFMTSLRILPARINKKKKPSLAGRFIKFLASLVILLASIDALYLAFSFMASPLDLSGPFQPIPIETHKIPDYDNWTGAFTSGTPINRKIISEINPQNINATIQLSLDAKEPLANILIGSQLQPPSSGFLLAAFGQANIYGKDITDIAWNGPSWMLDPETNQVTVSFDAVVPIEADSNRMVYIYWQPSSNFSATVNDELRISLKDASFRLASEVPAIINKDQVVLKSEGKPLEPVSLKFEPVVPVSETSPLTRQKFIYELGRIFIPFLNRILFACVELFPLLVLALVGCGYIKPSTSIPRRLKYFTFWILIVHFTLYFLIAHTDLYERYIVPLLSEFFSHNLSGYFSVDMQVLFRNGIADARDPAVTALLGILLPLVFLRSVYSYIRTDEEPKLAPTDEKKPTYFRKLQAFLKEKAWKYALMFIIELLPIAGLAAVAFYVWQVTQGEIQVPACALGWVNTSFIDISNLLFTCTLPQWVPLLTLISVAAKLVKWSITWVGNALWGRKINRETSRLATLVILFITIYPAVYLQLPGLKFQQDWVWFGLGIFLGTILLYQFGMAVTRHALATKIPINKKNIAIVVLVIAFVFAIPAYFGGGRGVKLGYQDDLPQLAFILDNLLIYVWVAACLWLLYVDGQKDLSVNIDNRWIGILACASILYKNSFWLYIPVTFLLGWWALGRLVRNPLWDKKYDLDAIAKVIWDKRPLMLKNISLLRTAERTFGAVQTSMRQKLSTGDENFKTVKTSLEQHLNAIQRLRNASLKGVSKTFKNIPLAFGPHKTAWENGIHGAEWSFLFAIPWLITYFISFMQETNFPHSYILTFVIDMLSIFSFWVAIGFFMGYFFPYLRGDTGFQKGLRLAMTIILPTLPLHIVFYQSLASWQGFFLWAFQVFLECALLGLLAFDYVSIRQAGNNWQTLLEIHGLLPLGVWTSGTLALLATAITNLIASPEQAQVLMNSALQIIVPVISQADKLVK
jgi:hypothetical protein